LNQLPNLPVPQPTTDGRIAIKKRLRQTRFLAPAAPPDQTPNGPVPEVAPAASLHSLGEDLALLYRLALQMGSAATYLDLGHVALDGLLEAIPADVGAILTVKEGRDLEVSAHRQRDESIKTYHKVSQFVSSEVISTREAVLAEDVSRDQYLRNRES